MFQFCEQNNLYILPHPPTPQIWHLLTFFIWIHEKKLEGVKFNSVDELIDAIQSIFEEIKQEVLKAIFIELEKHFKKFIAANGEYFKP